MSERFLKDTLEFTATVGCLAFEQVLIFRTKVENRGVLQKQFEDGQSDSITTSYVAIPEI